MRRRVGFKPAARNKKKTKEGVAAEEDEEEEEDDELLSESAGSDDDDDEEEDDDDESMGSASTHHNDVIAMHAMLPPLPFLPLSKTKTKKKQTDMVTAFSNLHLNKTKKVQKAATDPGPVSVSAPVAVKPIGATRRKIMEERMRLYTLLPSVIGFTEQVEVEERGEVKGTEVELLRSLSPEKSDSGSSEEEEEDSFHSAEEGDEENRKGGESGSDSDGEAMLGRLRGLLDKIRVE